MSGIEMYEQQEMLIAEIIKGKRFRKDLGDLEELKKSISEIGLLHPIVVRPDKRLIAGGRRLVACEELEWEKIPVRIIDIEKISRGEHDENVCRKDFTWSEAVAIKREIEPEEKAAAKERQWAGVAAPSANLAEGSKGQARDKAAKATGKKRTSLAKAEAVVAAAEAEPENQELSKIVAEMDESGNVDRALKKAKEAQGGEKSKHANTGLAKQIREIFSDVKWHSLEELSKTLDIPIEDYESDPGAHPIGRALRGMSGKNAAYSLEKKGNTWRTFTFRLVPKRLSETEPAIPLAEITAKLSPLVKFLEQQGKCHAATVNIPEIAHRAGTLRLLLDEWTKRHSAKDAALNASPSPASKKVKLHVV